jgi:hypothetical protein
MYKWNHTEYGTLTFPYSNHFMSGHRKWVQGNLSRGKMAGDQLNHPHPPNAEVKNGGIIFHFHMLLRGMVFN